jgi:histidyl-tRNA synthetase
MQKGPVTPKGFRDIMPATAKKRRQTINTICDILEKFDFVPLETPTLEFAETLLGKYGEEEKLIYQFEDRGGRKLALRYDLTVPLARFIANNLGVLNPTFSRYQIGQSFRGENPQKGRYREFTQFDMDTVGEASPKEDAKIIAAAIAGIRAVGFKKAAMMINDRTNFSTISIEEIRLIDKYHKIDHNQIPAKLIEFIQNSKPTENLNKIFKILETDYRLKKDIDYVFDPTLARGLDYYTSTILELKPVGHPEELTIGGGGRYDNLIGTFAGKSIPAVGFSFGIDRIVDLL